MFTTEAALVLQRMLLAKLLDELAMLEVCDELDELTLLLEVPLLELPLEELPAEALLAELITGGDTPLTELSPPQALSKTMMLGMYNCFM